ncbi:MAG TPA: histidine--tRNA ligase [Vicinamibacterales bacterium]|jgi:histidyl-tRNA synthetase|nr:histidine--tRNA ligase [Vicinamibacterales bacterium]
MATQPARGMRDFLPDDIRRREHVVRVIRDVYDRYGFEPLETPAVENIETLLGKYGDEGNKLIFKILKRGEHEATGQADLALRYDLTVPLARVAAEYQAELPKFFKRYQIQPVWRADRPARGRFREFYQCDIDAIGSTSLVVEAEMCAAASDVLTTLGFNDFTIRLNHRGLLAALLRRAGIPEAKHGPVLVELDKLDKVGEGIVRAAVAELLGSAAPSEEIMALFVRLTALPGDASRNDKVFGELRTFLGDQENQAVSDLAAILRLSASTSAAGRARIDPSLARGLSYYTGTIMEISVPDLAGSLGGGGRYDNLIGLFLGKEVPACGFSLGLERILVVMDERKMFPASVVGRNADVMVTIWDHAAAPDSLALAADLRRGRLRVDVYPEADKLGKQLKYASGRSIPFVTVVGDDEKAAGTVTVKDLRSGGQQAIARVSVTEYIRQKLDNAP